MGKQSFTAFKCFVLLVFIRQLDLAPAARCDRLSCRCDAQVFYTTHYLECLFLSFVDYYGWPHSSLVTLVGNLDTLLECLFRPSSTLLLGSASGLLSFLLLPRYFGRSLRHALFLQYSSFVYLISLLELSSLSFLEL